MSDWDTCLQSPGMPGERCAASRRRRSYSLSLSLSLGYLTVVALLSWSPGAAADPSGPFLYEWSVQTIGPGGSGQESSRTDARNEMRNVNAASSELTFDERTLSPASGLIT
jgi:hypothetical protein